jgi:hypothetical protein
VLLLLFGAPLGYSHQRWVMFRSTYQGKGKTLITVSSPQSNAPKDFGDFFISLEKIKINLAY